MKVDEEALTKEREEAWIGDAVLALYVREWILAQGQGLDGEAFIRFSSNDFLRFRGNPTSVEAEIGRVYSEHGLQAGFDWISEHLLPRFLEREKQLAAIDKKGRKKKRG
ncbi:hypothetical protein [Roseibacillus ishigakijimensis]|uniref:Uncharacterized protein n=1 Tax=Roseibacillus ishigakijimensis TaxID=454146 RepID=A0A934RNL5_9BACT|nr:hypothetical protein [Roseibacillus ishigakijimensis]MBK1834128.1 hypothetical protein [Roseibacillus ishigakijimensis]